MSRKHSGSGPRFEMASMNAHRVGSMEPMREAREEGWFSDEEERRFQAMEAISPKWGWPKAFERIWSIEDRARYSRIASKVEGQ